MNPSAPGSVAAGFSRVQWTTLNKSQWSVSVSHPVVTMTTAVASGRPSRGFQRKTVEFVPVVLFSYYARIDDELSVSCSSSEVLWSSEMALASFHRARRRVNARRATRRSPLFSVQLLFAWNTTNTGNPIALMKDYFWMLRRFCFYTLSSS